MGAASEGKATRSTWTAPGAASWNVDLADVFTHCFEIPQQKRLRITPMSCSRYDAVHFCLWFVVSLDLDCFWETRVNCCDSPLDGGHSLSMLITFWFCICSQSFVYNFFPFEDRKQQPWKARDRELQTSVRQDGWGQWVLPVGIPTFAYNLWWLFFAHLHG